MEPRELPRKSISGKLWLLFGSMVSVLVLTSLIYFWQIQRINSDINEILDVQRPLEHTVLDMRAYSSLSARSVTDYLMNRDPADVEKAREAESGFRAAMASFNSLAVDDASEHLWEELSGLFEDFKGKADGITLLSDRQYTTNLILREDLREIDKFLNGLLQVVVIEVSPDAENKLEAVIGMRESLDMISVALDAYLVQPSPALETEILDEYGSFEQSSTAYRGQGVSSYEDAWLDHIDSGFEEATGNCDELIAVTKSLDELLADYRSSVDEIDVYLDNDISAYIEARAVEASREAEASTRLAVIGLLILGIIGIITAIVSALVLSKYLVGPLSDLVRGARMVGSGRLQQRFNTDAKGEFGQLAISLNQMLETLGRSQDALGESEELAWALLDATNDAVILTDRRGMILASNEIAAGRFGKSLEQMVDESLYDLLSPEAAASMKAHIAEVIRTGKPEHYEEEREGKIIEQNIYPVTSIRGETTRVAIFSRDVTVRKWVEDVTEQLARRNQLILESAGEGIFGLDTQGRTTFVNPAAARMLGYAPDELVGQRHHEFVHHTRSNGKSYPNQECPIYAAFKDGIVRSSVDDEVFWRKNGTSFPVEYTSTPIVEEGRILGAVVTFQDITVRKQVEKALRQSEENYRSILETATSLIVSMDLEGVIVDGNSQIQDVLGHQPDSVIGKKINDFIHPGEREKMDGLLGEVITKGFEYGNRFRMLHKNGSFIDVSINAAAVKDTGGEYARIICMIDRTTERISG